MRHVAVGVAALVIASSLGSSLLRAEPPRVPVRTPPTARAVPNAEGTAFALAALARYANGINDNSVFDRQVALWLGRVRNGRAAAKRLVARFERLTEAERAVHLPGVASLSGLGTRAFVPGQFQKIAASYAASLVARVPPPVDTLPPQSANQLALTYQLDYAGLACNQQAAPAAAGDNVAVFVANVTHTVKGAPVTIATQMAPASGTISGMTTGHTSSQGAATVFSQGYSPYTAFDSGWLFVSALLRDEGDLAQQQDDLNTLFALASAFAANVQGDDRVGAFKQGLDYTMGVLHLSNPTRWSPNGVTSRLLTTAQYAAWASGAPQTQAGMSFQFQDKHDPGGSDYAIFFNTPKGLTAPNVKLTISRIAAVGTTRDLENDKADFEVDVTIGDKGTSHLYQKDHNVLTAVWAVERAMFAPAKVPITISVNEVDAPKAFQDLSGAFGGFGSPPGTCAYCGTPPNAVDFKDCSNVGPCAPQQYACDLNPSPAPYNGGETCADAANNLVKCPPQSTTTMLSLVYDLATGAITGDVTGKKGVVLTSTGTAGEPRRTAIDLKIE